MSLPTREDNNISTGRIGEDLACEFLESNGYRVIDRNFRKPWGEIDVIARDKDRTLVFVEVKTMAGCQTLKPEDNLTAAKLKKVQRTASLYANAHPELVKDRKGWRVDLIAITLDPEGSEGDPKIEHYQNIA